MPERQRGRRPRRAPSRPGRVGLVILEPFPVDGQAIGELVSGVPGALAPCGQAPPPGRLTLLAGNKPFDFLARGINCGFEAGHLRGYVGLPAHLRHRSAGPLRRRTLWRPHVALASEGCARLSIWPWSTQPRHAARSETARPASVPQYAPSPVCRSDRSCSARTRAARASPSSPARPGPLEAPQGVAAGFGLGEGDGDYTGSVAHRERRAPVLGRPRHPRAGQCPRPRLVCAGRPSPGASPRPLGPRRRRQPKHEPTPWPGSWPRRRALAHRRRRRGEPVWW